MVNKSVPDEINVNDIEVKQKFEGKVLKTTLQGALVDIGSKLPAFIHISQVVKNNNPKLPVNSIEEVCKAGDTISVWVKRIKKDRIELSMIPPLDLEWREIKPDMVVKGKVVRLETFGVFVDIGAERPGLIHISEIAQNYVRTPSDVVHEGDEVEVKVLEIDRRKKQIKLSMKALEEVKEEPIVEKVSKGGKKSKAKNEEPAEEEVVIPDPTVMEIAMRQAMEKAKKTGPKDAETANRMKKYKEMSSEQQEIIERTLKNKESKE